MTSVNNGMKNFKIETNSTLEQANVIVISHFYNRKSVDGTTPAMKVASYVAAARNNNVIPAFAAEYSEDFNNGLAKAFNNCTPQKWLTEADSDKIDREYTTKGRVKQMEMQLKQNKDPFLFKTYLRNTGGLLAAKSIRPIVDQVIAQAETIMKGKGTKEELLVQRDDFVTGFLEIEDRDDFLWNPARLLLIKYLDKLDSRSGKVHLIFVDYYLLLEHLPFQKERIEAIGKSLAKHKFVLLTPKADKEEQKEERKESKKS